MRTNHPEEPGRNTWNETRSFHPNDMLLRSYGYTIAERATGKEPVWKLGDRLVPEAVAMAEIKGC